MTTRRRHFNRTITQGTVLPQLDLPPNWRLLTVVGIASVHEPQRVELLKNGEPLVDALYTPVAMFVAIGEVIRHGDELRLLAARKVLIHYTVEVDA